MNIPKASHPPAPYVPTQLKKADWVFLAGPNASVHSGLYKFEFRGTEGAQNASLPITRGIPEQAYFQVHDSFQGKYEVFGIFVDTAGTIFERSFGVTEIS